MTEFFKYQGTGNDFVMIDNRQGLINLTTEDIEKVCHRRFGVGADGLIMIENIEGYDFKMKYYNADGREGSMCGNGGRCAVQFASDLILKLMMGLFSLI
jgi:diaminopimelate epimerase